MSEIYKEIEQEELKNLPVESLTEEDVTTTRDILTLFVNLFIEKHA